LNLGKRTAAVTAQGVAYRGLIDEVAIYNRALASNEIQLIYAAGQEGKCAQPSIVVQPASQTVVVGADVTFSVVASGNGPFTYIWRRNEVEIAGATESSFTITNVQPNDAGAYSVVVANASGAVLSDNAVLTVTLPRATLSIPSTTQSSGRSVSVPILLNAPAGNANSLSFSLNFDPGNLVFESVTLGSDAANAVLLPNTTRSVSGAVGVGLALFPGETFPAGPREILVFHFTATEADGLRSASLMFGDLPVPRQLSDALAQAIAVDFLDGTITLLPSQYEGDSAPRPSGNRVLNVFDWTQVGRFVAGLDTLMPGEFERADCAPRLTLGDGQLNVADWVQAGRYAIGLDRNAVAGGPTEPLPPVAVVASAGSASRLIRVADGNVFANQTLILPVTLQAEGNENALGFTLRFDPSKLSFVGASKGQAAGAATLFLNSNLERSGQLGVLMALPSGTAFPAGVSELMLLTFKVNLDAAGNGAVEFANQPVATAVADSDANQLSARFVSSSVSIAPLPVLEIQIASGTVILSWPATAVGFELQSCTSLAPGDWTVLPGALQSTAERNEVVLPLQPEARYFRLIRPF
jgi:hypothetical protein